jgi:hypothetical protein
VLAKIIDSATGEREKIQNKSRMQWVKSRNRSRRGKMETQLIAGNLLLLKVMKKLKFNKM